jgi:hypothetical protein
VHFHAGTAVLACKLAHVVKIDIAAIALSMIGNLNTITALLRQLEADRRG